MGFAMRELRHACHDNQAKIVRQSGERVLPVPSDSRSDSSTGKTQKRGPKAKVGGCPDAWPLCVDSPMPPEMHCAPKMIM